MARVRKKKPNRTNSHDRDYYLEQSKGDCYKRKFSTKKQALSNRDTQIKKVPSLILFVYKCPYCHKWHLTKQPTRNNQQGITKNE